VADWRKRLTGQGNYGPLRNPYTHRSPQHLWNHVGWVPAQETLVVYTDGTVAEGHSFTHEEMYGPTVHKLLVGGYDYRCPEFDAFTLSSLKAAGYTCCNPDGDIYYIDTLDDEYDPNDTYSLRKECD